ncbi:MAG TPA: amino acid adenylation domain-containing protein [Candidatus Limnocylindrales bacterium]
MPTVPLTAAQSGVWFTEQIGDNAAAYHLPLRITFDGGLDLAALSAAVDAVAARHPVLGAAVVADGGVPGLRLGAHDLSLRRGAVSLTAPFDLNGGPLARIGLDAVGPDRHELVLVAHHLVFDGMSKDVFVADLARAYRGRALPPPVGYAEAVAAEQNEVARTLEEARAFWAGRWHQPTELLLPGLSLSPEATGAHPGAEIVVPVPGRDRLVAVAGESGLTLFELLLATMHLMLHGYGNEASTVAIDAGTRPRQARDLIGLFVNEIPVTTLQPGRSSFGEFATGLRGYLRDSYLFRNVPLARVATLSPGAALSPVSASYRYQGPAPEFPGMTVHIDWSMFSGTTRGALQLMAVGSEDDLTLTLRHSTRLVPASTAAQIAGHLGALLESIPDNPAMVGPAERVRLAESGTGPAPAPATTLTRLLRAGMRRDREAPVLVGDGLRMTHGQLWQAATRLAGRLRRAGVGPGSVVGVAVDRSADAVVAVLAVLESGAAYLPLDPRYPPDRLAFMLADASPAALIVPSRGGMPSGDIPVVALDETGDEASAVSTDVRPGDPAYVIYTSGSTGRPKGVQVSHRAIANLVQAMCDQLDAGRGDVWLLLTSLSFDIAALEMFVPLAVGAQAVVVPDEAARDGAALLRLIDGHRVTHAQATPSSWELLLEAGIDAPGLTAVCGGEALSAALATRLHGRVGRLINAYGPTETTVWSTLSEVTDPDAVTIGRPIAGTTTYVLDKDLHRVPFGVAGELCVSGAGVADHYLRRPALTAECFVPNPYGPAGSRLYRTGDQVRLNPDGTIVYLGREDRQVKIRGHRVELDEIEAQLHQCPGVQQAVVSVFEPTPGDRHLAAYLAAPAPSVTEVRAFLAQRLPQHMLPSAFTVIDQIPLTPNNKVDRKALPPPSLARDALPHNAVAATDAATDAVTKAVAEIWCEVLGLGEVGLDEDLFDLGGHSLTLTKIAARLRDDLGADVPLHVLWDASTVTAMAVAVRGQASA